MTYNKERGDNALFVDQPDFREAVKCTIKDIIDEKLGLDNLTYPFQSKADAIEVLGFIDNENLLYNYSTNGLGIIQTPKFKKPALTKNGRDFFES